MQVRDQLHSFGYRWIGAGMDTVGRGVARVERVLTATANGTVQMWQYRYVKCLKESVLCAEQNIN